MAGLKILCPFCGKPTKIRSSERPTPESTIAYINCPHCNELNAKFIGQLVEVKRAVFIEYENAQQWEKLEQAFIKEGKIQPKEDQSSK